MTRAMDDIITASAKVMIGIFGTGTSILLSNISEFAAICAAVATAVYMCQQFLNAREKGRQLKNKD